MPGIWGFLFSNISAFISNYLQYFHNFIVTWNIFLNCKKKLQVQFLKTELQLKSGLGRYCPPSNVQFYMIFNQTHLCLYFLQLATPSVNIQIVFLKSYSIYIYKTIKTWIDFKSSKKEKKKSHIIDICSIRCGLILVFKSILA